MQTADEMIGVHVLINIGNVSNAENNSCKALAEVVNSNCTICIIQTI